MPLTPADNGPDIETLCVYFWMWDGEQPIRCCVTSGALRILRPDVFGAIEETNERLFITYRDEVERAASRKYDRGFVDAFGVLVTSSDFNAV